jgi:hypothetical protein
LTVQFDWKTPGETCTNVMFSSGMPQPPVQ